MQSHRRFVLIGILILGASFLFGCAAQTPPPAPTLAATSVPTALPATATSVPPSPTAVPPIDTAVPPTAPFTATALPSATATLSQAEAIQTMSAATGTAVAATKAAQPTATTAPPTATKLPQTATKVPPSATKVVVPPTKAPQPTQSAAQCPIDPGNAGILVINNFDGLMTFTVLNHEYKLDGHTQQWVQVPGGQNFTASVSVVGVGKTNFGPLTLQPGQCVKYEPTAG